MSKKDKKYKSLFNIHVFLIFFIFLDQACTKLIEIHLPLPPECSD